ncbi:MAG: amino acid permease, partial [Actinomycetota bacterium]|nr:amino acid permease [Actinomycetota bacterium]
SYSMGQHRQLPESIRRIHPRFRTPWVAIITFAVLATITMLPGKVSFLATMYSFGAMLSFTIAHAAVLWLRKRLPEVDREWIPPLNFRLRGVSLPLTAILGGIGTLLAWLVVMALNPVTLAIGMGWLVVGIAGYTLYRRHQHLPLTRTVKVVLPEPLGVEEIEYRSVLVALNADQPFPEEVIATATKLTSSQRRAIHIVALLTVPTHLPLGHSMKEEQRDAERMIERAKRMAGTRISGRVERVRPGEAGYFISRQARATRAEAVVIGLRSRGGVPQYGRTLETLMRERPCRIIVVSEGNTDHEPAVDEDRLEAGFG